MRDLTIDLEALRSFVAGIEAGSFARAADRLGRSTSAVSAQLHKLEAQTGLALVRREGRGLVLTEGGETLLSYARRLLALNDEAVGALRGGVLEGWVRLGLQEDFGETVLPQVLGRFARAHPRVKIEGRIARNAEMKEKIAAGQLDLALAWDDGTTPASERVATLPLCWLGSSDTAPGWRPEGREPLPLVALEAPCLMRAIACEALDRAGIAWRIAFVSPSVGGLWAATAAGLGFALRTPVSRPTSVRTLDAAANGLPALPPVGLLLHRAKRDAAPAVTHLATILRQAVQEALPQDWVVEARPAGEPPAEGADATGPARPTEGFPATAQAADAA